MAHIGYTTAVHKTSEDEEIDVIVVLDIPKMVRIKGNNLNPNTIHRKSIVDPQFAQSRCKWAFVLKIYEPETGIIVHNAIKDLIKFRVGEWVNATFFTNDLETIFGSGIFYFLDIDCVKSFMGGVPKNGKYINANIDGELRERYNMSNGKKNGLYESWSNGWLIKKCFFKNGINHGEYYEYYGDDKVKISCNFVCGKKSGDYNEYYENGMLHIFCHYKNGQRDGFYKEWYENGKMGKKCYYIDGRLYNDCFYWDKDGRPIRMSSYIDDKMITCTRYSKNGFVI